MKGILCLTSISQKFPLEIKRVCISNKDCLIYLKTYCIQLHLVHNPGVSKVIEIKSPVLDYDAKHDYHHLRFTAELKDVDIWVYKVLSYSIDGEDKWIGCPLRQDYEFVTSVRKNILS